MSLTKVNNSNPANRHSKPNQSVIQQNAVQLAQNEKANQTEHESDVQTAVQLKSDRDPGNDFIRPNAVIQAKLNIGKPNDKYEVEADQMADKVVSGAPEKATKQTSSPTLQKKDAAGAIESEGIKEEEVVETDIQQKPEKVNAGGEDDTTVQEKPLSESITPVVQLKELPPIQRMTSDEEKVQTKCSTCGKEENVQASDLGTESILQTKCSSCADKEKDVQKMDEDSEESEVQTKLDSSTEEEGAQAPDQGAESDLQTKLDTSSDESPVQKMAEPQEEKIQTKCSSCGKEKEASKLNVQKKCSKCESEEKVQQKSNGEGSSANVESSLKSSKGKGSPMDDTTKGSMESGFGSDFSGVRIHTDSNAVQMNKDLGSKAFTNGSDVYFNEGQYSPSSKGGQHLLAHELTHTVQQGAAPAGVQKMEATEEETPVQTQLDVNAERLHQERIVNDNSVPSAKTEETPEETPEETAENENSEDIDEKADAGGKNDQNAGENSNDANAGGGDITVGGGGEGGNCEPECYREPTEEPDEEPDKEPENPEGAQVDAEKDDAGPDDVWEEIDDCPTDQAEAQGAAIEPTEGAATEGDPTATTEENAENPENAENAESKQDAGGGDKKKAPAQGGNAMAGVIASAEGERSTSVAAYQASSSSLSGSASQNGAVKSQVSFVTNPSENLEQNEQRQQATNRANGFFSSIGDRLEDATSYGLEDIPNRIGATAEAAKAQIGASMEAQKNTISSRIQRARGEAKVKAEATRQAVHTQTTNYITDVETQTAAAIETLNTTYTDTMTNIGDLETTTLDMINQMYIDARANMISLGPTIGKEYKDTAETMAVKYKAFKNCTKNGFWDGNLSQRRAAAQVEAAREVGQTHYDKTVDSAREQAIEVTKNGRKVDRCSIIASANQSRSTLDENLPQLISALESTRDAAIEQARATETSLIAGIDGSLTSTLDQLDEQEYMQRQAINDTGYMQQVMQESTAHAAAAATQQGIQSAVSSIQSSITNLKAQLSSSQAPNPQELDNVLSQVEQNINAAVDGLFSSADTGISTAEAQLNNNLQQAITSLQGITQSNENATSKLMGDFNTGMNGISGVDNFAAQRTSFTTQVQQSVDSSVEALVKSFEGFQDSCIGTIEAATTRLAEAEVQLEENLRLNQEGLKCEITASANDAASKEAPAWKQLLAILIIILVIIIIIAVTVFTAGAGGAALVAALGGPLLAGAIIGAVVGAVVSGLITMATNLWTNQDVMEGVGDAMIKGAITGAAGGFLGAAAGVGAGVVFQTATKGVQVAAQFGAAMISGGGFDVVTQYIDGGFSFDKFSWGQLGFTLFTTALTFGIGHKVGSNAKPGVVDGPDGAPIIDGPDANPVIDGPDTNPVIDGPDANPVIDGPDANPVVDGPDANPIVDGPDANPVVDGPDANPVVDGPESKPVVDGPDANPVVDGPESKPVVDGPENAPVNDADADVNTNKNNTDADSQNSKPLTDQESVNINNDEGVVAKTPTSDGHEIKITKDGRIVKCSTCAEFKAQYEAEMNSNGKLLKHFNDVDAMPNGQAKSDAVAKMNNDMVAAKSYTGGAKQARQLGYPVDGKLPAGHHWRSGKNGPSLVKNSSHDGPALKYDEGTNTFPPKKVANGNGSKKTPANDADGPENSTVNDVDAPENNVPKDVEVTTEIEPATDWPTLEPQLRSKLNGKMEAKIANKIVEKLKAAGPEGKLLGERIKAGEFDTVDGYIDLIKKASSGGHLIKATNQAITKAEKALASGVPKERFRFEHDKGTGRHDVDFGIKNANGTSGYEKAYQFKTLEGKLTKGKIQDASIQLRDVNATNKIVEMDCPYTEVSELSNPGIVREMKFQHSRNGITEFQFILNDGSRVVIDPSTL